VRRDSRTFASVHSSLKLNKSQLLQTDPRDALRCARRLWHNAGFSVVQTGGGRRSLELIKLTTLVDSRRAVAKVLSPECGTELWSLEGIVLASEISGFFL